MRHIPCTMHYTPYSIYHIPYTPSVIYLHSPIIPSQFQVRLFDPSVEIASAPAHNDNSWFSVEGVEYNKYISESSATGILIEAFPYSAENLKKLPISESIMEDIKKGLEIGEGEKKIVLRQLTEWMSNVFPPLKQKIPLIDPR
ncbi:hypothetical protein EON65_46320 [archaeon]|nr:MAG: hypothetical protein EON65_46320 [archaeon]